MYKWIFIRKNKWEYVQFIEMKMDWHFKRDRCLLKTFTAGINDLFNAIYGKTNLVQTTKPTDILQNECTSKITMGFCWFFFVCSEIHLNFQMVRFFFNNLKFSIKLESHPSHEQHSLISLKSKFWQMQYSWYSGWFKKAISCFKCLFVIRIERLKLVLWKKIDISNIYFNNGKKNKCLKIMPPGHLIQRLNFEKNFRISLNLSLKFDWSVRMWPAHFFIYLLI